MVFQVLQKELVDNGFLKRLFHLLTLTLLSLSFPLSILLLARLSFSHYLLTLSPLSESKSFSSPFFRYPFLLYLIVTFVAIVALFQSFEGKLRLRRYNVSVPRLYIAWFFLCSLQVGVGMGIKKSVAVRVDYSSRFWFRRLGFFLGLHETMLHWSTMAVKPVVDDTVFGLVEEEWRWSERAAMAASLGLLWWWRLRDEVELLVVVSKMKRDLGMEIDWDDFVHWFVYYVVVVVGFVKVVKNLFWLGKNLLFERESMKLCEFDQVEEV